jgi:predicted kinase
VAVTHIAVSGVPGSGKSALAAGLARAFGLPLLAKDPVKEALWDQLGSGDVEWSQRLGHAANEVILSIAASAPSSVLDSLWHHEWAIERLGALPANVVEVFCDCPPAQARQRYQGRVRHPAHFDGIRALDSDLWAGHQARPLFDDCIRIDTTAPTDIDAVVSAVRAQPRWNASSVAGAPALVVVTGLPRTGKSAIAQAISRATGAAVFGRDVIGAAVSRAGVTPSGDPTGAAFDLLGVLAIEQFKVGSGAIFDSVGGNASTRVRWHDVATAHGIPLYAIECVCSDEQIHRQRLKGRRRNIPGWYELDWTHVENVRARYEPWNKPRLVLDAKEPLATNVAAAVHWVTGTDRANTEIE